MYATDTCRQIEKIGPGHDVKIMKAVMETILNLFSTEAYIC